MACSDAEVIIKKGGVIMHKFGEKFEKYEPLVDENIAIPETKKESAEDFFDTYSLKKSDFPQLMPPDVAKYGVKIGEAKPILVARSIISNDEIPSTLKDELNKIVIGVAPTANVYQIPPDQKDLDSKIKQTLSVFDYYLVELGLNVMLNQGYTIPQLLFEVDLTCDKNRTDVTALDIFPTDKITNVQIVSGKIGVNLTKMLEFIPSPIGTIASALAGKVIDIEINPWEFNWSYDKYKIDAAGRMNYEAYWKIYDTTTVQTFNPTLTLKVRKGVKKVFAKVRAIYSLRSSRWMIFTEPEVRTSKMDVQILPI